MISFGMMSLSLKSELSYFTEIARRANPDLFTCYRFAPAKIHPLTEMVTGKRFNHEKDLWEDTEFPLPKIVYDRCFYTNDLASKQSMAIVKWLKSRRDITFLGSGLPNKRAIYDVLANSELSPYIPATFPADNGKMVTAQLNKWKKAILKPVFGSGGAGIYSIEKKGKDYAIAADHGGKLASKSFSTAMEMEAWLDRLFSKSEYLLQPYLNLRDSKGCPFDIRLLLQKDHTGSWTLRGKGIRRGSKDGILSNLSAGGEIIAVEEYIDTLEPRTKKFILQELDDIILKLPAILEAAFPLLFELGVDIGVSNDHALWVLDTNSKPGRKVIVAANPALKDILYTAPLDYARLLSENLTEREEQHL
ncbi:YheC/YheD family protein [Mesobacillus subterraneus]|nr:YheC/YheD family protein [Mesobacillus subterraneus]